MATAPRLQYALALQNEIRRILDADPDLRRVIVTCDALDVPSGARYGVIVILPPEITFVNWDQTDNDYDLNVIAGPPDNLQAAWERLDQIIEALRVGNVNMSSAKGEMFATKNGPILPGYSIPLHPVTLTSSDDDD